MIDVFIPVKPVPKGRPRFVRATGHVYTPSKTIKAEQDMALIVKNHMQLNGISITSDNVSIEATFHLDGKKKYNPDLDNLIKTLCDSLNKVVWDDDKQVYKINAVKSFGPKENEGIELKVRGI